MRQFPSPHGEKVAEGRMYSDGAPLSPRGEGDGKYTPVAHFNECFWRIA